MTGKAVTDETLGLLARKQHDLFRRVREGTLDSDQVLAALQRVIEGDFGTRTIDCDAPIPDGIKEGFERRDEDQLRSRVRGKVAVDPANPFNTFLTEGQKAGRVGGNDVLAELRRLEVSVYGIAALEQFRRDGLIPDEFKGQAIFAWGDILRGGDGRRYVRYVCWGGVGWRWGYRWVGRGWSSSGSAAVRAS